MPCGAGDDEAAIRVAAKVAVGKTLPEGANAGGGGQAPSDLAAWGNRDGAAAGRVGKAGRLAHRKVRSRDGAYWNRI